MNKQENLLTSLGESTTVFIHLQTHIGHSIPNKQKKHKILIWCYGAENEVTPYSQHQSRMTVTCLSLTQTII